MKRFAALALLTVAISPTLTQEVRWFKGNTHTHTINTDGDSSPDTVVRWYKEHGYQFLVITDHDMLTPTDGLNSIFAAPGKFLIMQGEEVTDNFNGAPVHLNAIFPKIVVAQQHGTSVAETMQKNARAIRAAGGLPQLNHPNFGWAITAADILAAPAITHFEVWNGHPLVHNRGGGGSPSTEEIWDAVLSTGRKLYGLATDDVHHFKNEYSTDRANPGRGWIMVRARELSPQAIVAAIERGDFYASTGVRLKSNEVNSTEIRIELPEATGRTPRRYRTHFIGKDGVILKTDVSLAPSYAFTGNELYIRARIESSAGEFAWTQPIFPVKR
jgi:hypothetical protein